MRLQRFLARCGVASRRASEDLIRQGRVSVNGQAVSAMGVQVGTGDEVCVDGIQVKLPDETVVIALNKPLGYTSSMADPHAKKCVAELVPADEYPGLFPVGRLDVNTQGLLLFTNDGDLGHALLHPSRKVEKTYVVVAQGQVSKRDISRLERGIDIDGRRTAPAKISNVSYSPTADAGRSDNNNPAPAETSLQITIHEGRKREIRRMFDAVGHSVLHLTRIKFATVELGSLPSGGYRILTDEEVAALKVNS